MRDAARPALLGLALVGGGLVGCGPVGLAAPAQDADPMLVTVSRGTLEQRLLLSGELDAARSVELTVPATEAWQMSLRWMADDGVVVAAGDRLLEFDNTAILEQIGELQLAVAEAAVELDSQQAQNTVAIEDKRMEVETQRVAVEKARLDVGIPEGLVSRYEARKFELELTRAQAALASAEDELRAAQEGGRLDLEVRQIALGKAERALADAERQLASLTIEAPRDGVFVVEDQPWEGRKFEVGDMVWPGMTVARLPDLSEITIEAALSDVDDGRIAPGMRASCTVDAFPDLPVAAVIRSVSPIARSPGRRSSLRSFAVVLDLDDTDPERMRPGLSVKVEVTSRRREDLLVVPRAAVRWQDERASVTRADGERTDVEIDGCNANTCAIAAGVAEGDRVRANG